MGLDYNIATDEPLNSLPADAKILAYKGSWKCILAASLPVGSHTHTIDSITGLESALDGKADASHGHAIGDVTGLQAALDAKAATVHGHAIGDVIGLQAALDAKATKLNAVYRFTDAFTVDPVAHQDAILEVDVESNDGSKQVLLPANAPVGTFVTILQTGYSQFLIYPADEDATVTQHPVWLGYDATSPNKPCYAHVYENSDGAHAKWRIYGELTSFA